MLLITEKQTMQWPKERERKNNQWFPNTTEKNENWITPLKTKLMCSGRVCSSCATTATDNLITETNTDNGIILHLSVTKDFHNLAWSSYIC
jgi:hypothetical protein